MRVLVLGAYGLIGNNVVRAALAANWEVVAFERRSRRKAGLQGLPVEISPGTPSDPDALSRSMAGCDVVFHTLAYNPPNGLRTPQRLVEAREHVTRVLRAAGHARIGRLVYTSAACTIGGADSPGQLPDEWNRYRLGSIPHPFWDAKLLQEEAVLAFGREKLIPVIVVNPAEVLGPNDFDLQAARPLIDIARRGRRQYLPGTASIADAEDVAQGHLKAATLGRPGERYILAGHNLTRREIAATMAYASKRPAPDRPADLHRLERLARFSERVSCLGQPDRLFPLTYQVAAALLPGWYDSSKARQELEYTNRPLLDTCRATLGWLASVRMLR
jgi:dihydroflavonol-4-reductase